MPTILRIGAYRFFFYSNEGKEPSHIHIEQGDKVGKCWLDPIEFAFSEGFRSHELRKIRMLVIENRNFFLERWYEFFSH